jgi:ribosomal protein S27AE
MSEIKRACSNCGRGYPVVFCLEHQDLKAIDFACGQHIDQSEHTLREVFGPIELGLQIEMGLEGKHESRMHRV